MLAYGGSEIVNSMDVPDIVPIRRRPGRPPGTFDVAFFCRRLVEGMLESATTRIEQSTRTKKVYKAWSDAERSMALQLAFDKGSDSHAVTLLTTLFPATFGSLRESHIRYFRRKQEASKNVPKAEYRRGNMISGGALQDVVACIDAHVQAKLEFTTEEIRCIVIALLEEKHPHVLARGLVTDGDLEIFAHQPRDGEGEVPNVDIHLLDDADDEHVVAPAEAERPAKPAAKPAAAPAPARIPLSADVKEILRVLGYECHGEQLERVGLTGLPELQAAGKTNLVKAGMLAGHAGTLLQQVRRAKDCLPDAKRKCTGAKGPAAAKPKPRAQSPYHVGATVMHTRTNGTNVRCGIVKVHSHGFFDVSYDVHGKKVVKLRAP